MENEKQLHAYIERAAYKALRIAAAENELSVQGLAQVLIEYYLDNQEKVDRAMDKGGYFDEDDEDDEDERDDE